MIGRPGASHVTSGSLTLTTARLQRRADQLAHWLRRQGAGPGRVGLSLERSVDQVVGIRKAFSTAGAAYGVPVPSR